MSLVESNGVGAPNVVQTNWLTNLLPVGRDEFANDTSAENTPTATPTHHAASTPLQNPFGHQKPVNLLSEAVHQPERKLSEREKRDCEVIGTSSLLLSISIIKTFLFLSFVFPFH